MTSFLRTLALIFSLLLVAPVGARHKSVQHPKFDLKRPEIAAFVKGLSGP